MITRWYVQDASTGRHLAHPIHGAFIETSDIDYALERARKRFYHNVTVSNLEPDHLFPRGGKIRYLDPAEDKR